MNEFNNEHPLQSPMPPSGEEQNNMPLVQPQPMPLAVPPLVAEVQSVSWDFGEREKHLEKKNGKLAFFLIFGAVIVLALALLILVVLLGEGGFHIVKTITNERVVYVREDDGTSGLLTPNEVADVVKKSTVTVSVILEEGRSSGSGFVYDDKGHICTNYHVVVGAQSIQVVLADGRVCDAYLVGYQKDADIAILRVEADGLQPAKLGNSADLLVGDDVVAVGSPKGLELSGTATFGKVSATNRWLAVDDDVDGVYEKKLLLIQTDTSVNPGNSGGPMADMYGRVVGVVVRKMNNNEALGFAIPIDGVKEIADQLIKKGTFTGVNPLVEGRSLLGVTGHGGVKDVWYLVDPVTGKVESSTFELPGYHKMSQSGVYVISADQSNVQGKLYEGDIILAVNGWKVTGTADLIQVVNLYRAGEAVEVKVLRGTQYMTVKVTLAQGEIS